MSKCNKYIGIVLVASALVSLETGADSTKVSAITPKSYPPISGVYGVHDHVDPPSYGTSPTSSLAGPAGVTGVSGSSSISSSASPSPSSEYVG